MKQIIITLTFSALLIGQSKVGTTAAPFLGIGIGPRVIAMGGASSSIATDASVMLINPGTTSRIGANQAMFAKTSWLVETDINFAAAVLRITRSGSMGFYFMQLDYGREEITELTAQDGTGLYWTASDIVTGLVYSQNLTDQFSIGGTLKFISQQIHNEQAASVASDIGLLYKSADGVYRIGMSISNFGADMIMDGKDLFRKIDLDSQNEGHNETIVARLKTDPWPLPLFFRVGVSSDLISTSSLKLILAGDTFIPSDDVESVHVGVEAGFVDRLFLRGGYRSIGNNTSEEGLTFGAGVKLYSAGFTMKIDYAVQDFGRFGYVPHWGISIGL